jgi:hypothetical protein
LFKNWHKGGKKVKKKILVLITVLATLFIFSLGNALARDHVLFPYWISGGGYATFVQVINLATVDTPITGTNQGKLHYVYVYNSDTETCQHYDNVGKTTQNDILLYEVTKAFYQGTSNEQLLPEDTTSTSPTLSSSPKWGYLVVTHHDDNFGPGHEGELFGQEYVVDLGTGTIWAINAINDPGETDTNNQFCANAGRRNWISWLPEIYASTMWYFFPVIYNAGLSQIDGIVWNVTTTVGCYGYEGVYDNNETLKSGQEHLMVGCWNTTKIPNGTPLDPGSGPVTANFFYTLEGMLTGEQFMAVANTGGWGCITFWKGGEMGGMAGYTYKLQSTQLLGNQMDIMLFEPYIEDKSSYTK